jgi:uncharacterized protein YjiK
MNKSYTSYLIYLLGIAFIISCGACKKKINYKSPQGYNFTTPEKYNLPSRLDEISGIAFIDNNAETVYAVNDEEGKVYRFNLTDKDYPFSKFSGKGDYEDLAILKNNRIVVLKSDGSLFVFPTDVTNTKEIKIADEFPQLLPKGEYEGIAAQENKVFVLCKDCPSDKKNKQVTIYEIGFTDGTSPKMISPFIANLSSLKKKQKFNPSCIAKNTITGEWYILSAADKLLVVMDEAWKLKDTYPLNPSVFRHPEGMAFSKNGDLYISNEAEGSTATILKFAYKGL